MWIASRHTPLLYVVEKNDNQYLISTKPFSRKSFKKLFKELENLKVNIIIENKIL